jgi:hypothetical protein
MQLKIFLPSLELSSMQKILHAVQPGQSMTRTLNEINSEIYLYGTKQAQDNVQVA